MTLSLRTSILLFAFVLAAFALPAIARATSTICYPDGCATFNFDGLTRTQLEIGGIQASLAQTFETMFQLASNTGHALTNVVRDAANRIVFIGCVNSHTHAAYYEECPPGFTRRSGQCVPTSATSTDSCPAGFIKRGNQCVFSTCPQGYGFRGGECVYLNICTTPPSCNGNNLMNSCTGAILQACDWGCAGSVCNPIPAPSATLKATPALVHQGGTTVISWTGTNVTSCVVEGTNSDSWTGIASGSSGRISSPILSKTIYTLHCVGYPHAFPPTVDKSVTVNIIPSFQEK